MEKILLIIALVFIIGYADTAYARVKCGDIDRKVSANVFYAAERVESHFNIKDKLEETCLFLKNIRKYEKKLPKSYMSRRYRKIRDKRIEIIENNMRGITSSLEVYRTWLHYKAAGSLEKSKRRIWLENSKRDATYYLRDIDDRIYDLKRLMMLVKDEKKDQKTVEDPVSKSDTKPTVERVLDHVIEEHH